MAEYPPNPTILPLGEPSPPDAHGIVKRVIPVQGDRLAFVLENVFSEQECQELIDLSESKGYEPALVNVGYGQQVRMPDYRNNDRVIMDDEALADRFYQRIKAYIPQRKDHRDALGLNERLRFLRYDPGQKFEPHHDGMYMRSPKDVQGRPGYEGRVGERSLITIQIYLNEGFEGGETRFINTKTREVSDCVPKTGLVLVFQQKGLLHEGCALVKGRKYTIRTEVMYAAKQTPSTAEDSDSDIC